VTSSFTVLQPLLCETLSAYYQIVIKKEDMDIRENFT